MTFGVVVVMLVAAAPLSLVIRVVSHQTPLIQVPFV